VKAPGIGDIEAAARLLQGEIRRTPMLRSRTLSEITGADIHLKFENLQYTASFKERGACVKLASMSEAERRQGVIAMSAGNHAQGVAYHGRKLGIDVTIVMPKATPFVKIDNTERLGARVVLFGETVDDAAAHARAIAREENRLFVHPYDDPAIVAGQGTVALEMLEDAPDLDVLIVPVGGGGLISGMTIAARARRPAIEVVGVEAELYPAVRQTLAGEPVVAGGRTVADGIAVKQPGTLTLAIIREHVDDIVLVSEAALERAILVLLEIEKTVVEGAGAAGLAAVLADLRRFAGRKVGIVLCGGNIDSRLLSAVIVRGLARSGRLIRYAVVVPDSPGSLADVARVIADAGGNVVDVAHQRAFSGRSVREVVVDFTLETRHERHAREIADALRTAGYAVLDRGALDQI